MGDGSGRTVLVTGANSGIGLATVLELAKRQFRTVGTVRSDEKADVVGKAAADAGVAVETEVLDVRDAEGCVRVIGAHRPWGLVNNAGYGMTGAIEDVDDEAVRSAFETMVLAPARLARLAVPTMRETGGGRIVNISSIYGRATTPLTGWYQACKHALEAWSDALRVEVARDGIDVILVEPGGFRTGIWGDNERDVEERADSLYGPAYRRTLSLTKLASPLMGDPARVARVIGRSLTARRPRARYLVGPDARGFALAQAATPTALKDRVTRLTLGL